MLVWLADYLSQFYSSFSIFQYLTLRGIFAVITALTISWVFGPIVIRKLNDLQMGQAIRSDGPQTHLRKAGTPTMGGALILLSIFISTLLWADLGNRYIWIVLGTTLAFGLVGWVDDYRKVVEKNPRGLPASWKYLWQSIFGLTAAIILYYTAQTPAETELIVPFFKNVALSMGPFYILFTYLVIVGTSNAVNLTDGLDGLAILPAVMVSGALGIIAYLTGNYQFATYLHIPYITGAGELLIISAALCGAGLGFCGSTLIPRWCSWAILGRWPLALLLA